MNRSFRFKVNLGGIIDILSNHLYSSPDVVIRELLQNAVDAIKARNNYEDIWNSGKISVSLKEEGNKKVLVFKDNGIGLTEEEIHRFLSIIGESSKRDLENKYIRSDYIGQFGIGLLSCFMISDLIKIVTKSSKNGECNCWMGRPDGTYEISKVEDSEEYDFGTSIFLEAKEGYERYFEKHTLMRLLKHYGLILPYPILLNDKNTHYLINDKNNIFDNLSKDELLLIGEEIFKERFLDCVQINIEETRTKGIIYISPNRNISNNKRGNRIYLKNMLLTEKGDSILPEWAFFVKGIISTDGLSPTASREGFYENDMLRETKNEIGKEIIKHLEYLSIYDKETLRRIIYTHALAIKSLIVEDIDLLNIFFDHFTFKTTRGEMTGADLLKEKFFYYTDSVDTYRQIAAVYRAENKLLVNGGYVHDDEILKYISFVYDNVIGRRVDAIDVNTVMNDITLKEKDECFNLLRVANLALKDYKCDVKIKRFSPKELPNICTIDEKDLRFRELEEGKNNSTGAFDGLFDGLLAEEKSDGYAKLWLNYDNEIIKNLIDIQEKHIISSAIKLLYVQSLLAGNMPMRYNEMNLLNEGILGIIQGGTKDE